MTDPNPDAAPKVFINCPYDHDFEPLRDALILSCLACGFFPTSAVVRGGGGRLRIDRIVTELDSSRYSIHDLSRCRGQGEENVARMNMPLELGMAMYIARLDSDRHDWMALVPDGPSHQAYVSDLAGYDPEIYDGTSTQLIYKTVSYLATREEATPGVGAKLVCDAMPAFEEEKGLVVQAWNGQPPPWLKLVEAGRRSLLAAAPAVG